MADPQDSSRLLDELKREVIESRNMTIKTDNALKTLLAELKTVSTQQHAFQTRTWFATGVAYLLFAALCVGGVVAISNARVASVNGERERLEKQVTELTATIEKLKAEQAGQQAAEQGAMQAYKMMVTLPGEERLKGIDAIGRLDQARLSAFARLVLQERSTALRKEVGQIVLERGKTAFRRNEFPEAVAQLSRFLSMGPPDEEAVDASFFLGNALFQLRKFDEASKALSRYVEQDKRSKVRDFAMVMLMQSYDMVGKREESLAVAREAHSTYPGSSYRPQFYLRMQRAGAGGTGPVDPATMPPPPPVPATGVAPAGTLAPAAAPRGPVHDAGPVAPAWRPSVGPLQVPDPTPGRAPSPPAPGAQPR